MSFLTVPELLRSAADRFRDAPALLTDDWAESFHELVGAVQGAATELRHRGLKPRDRVLIAAPNSAELVHVWMGAIWAGGIPAAVNPELKHAELDYVNEDLEPSVTLLHDEIADVGRGTAAGNEAGAAKADPMDVAAIVYTSGTTSRPKGVMVRHAAYTETGRSFRSWIGLGASERLWACMPFFHINAQAYSLMTTLAHGFSCAISPKFHASTFWQEACDLEVTSVNVVGAMLEFLAKQPEERWMPSSLHRMYAAPGPDPERRSELEARFQLRIVTGYGMSENPFGCIEGPTSRDKVGSIGRPRQPVSGAFENRLRILAPDGANVPDGEVGELCFQNAVMTPGYWRAQEITNVMLRDGWLHTGDAGYRDVEGDVFLTGRFKDMIRRRGENIAPAEVEDALREHPSVESVAVFGLAAGLEEEEVVAVVVLKRPATADEARLKSWAGTRLAAYKVPNRIFFRDSLPMTATHRVAKDALRQEYGRAVRTD